MRQAVTDLLDALPGLLERRWVCGDVFFFASRRWKGMLAAAATT